jgi:hypothetical protein
MFRLLPPAVALFGLALAGCDSLPASSDRPALIARPTPESNAEIRAVLERAIGPREIRIAPDAFTASSILALEPGADSVSADPSGAARGRLLGLPERFELVLNGGRCYLIRSSTRDRFALERTDCVPAEP